MLSYQDIVYDTVVKMKEYLLKGELPWSGSEEDILPINCVSGKFYENPLNCVRLLTEAKRKNFSSNRWIPVSEVNNIGCHVKYQERSVALIKWNQRKKEWFNPFSRSIEKKTKFCPSNCRVFGLDQVIQYNPPHFKKPHWKTVQKTVKAMIEKCRIKIIPGTTGYNPKCDCIEIPQISDFVNRNEYYDLLIWNLIRSTESPNRLCRETKVNGYKELLRCTIAHRIICGKLGILPNEITDKGVLVRWGMMLDFDYKTLSQTISEVNAILTYFKI